MSGILRWLGACVALGYSACLSAQLVAPPQIDWVSVPNSATVGQSVSVGAGAHANASDNSDGNDWNTSSRLVIAYIKIELQRPGQGWVTLVDWLNPWQTPAQNWTSFTVNTAGTHYVRVSAMDGRPWFTPEYVYAIDAVSPNPAITSQLTMNVNQGFNTSYQITATNSPTSFGLSGLPPGPAGFDPATGVITLRPTTGGTYSSTISATNSAGTDTKTLTWNVTAAVISANCSVSPASTTVGVPVTLTRSGSANFGIGWFSSLMWKPDGSYDSLGNQQAGSQSYTPTAAGSYTWQVWLFDSSGYNYVVQSVSWTAAAVQVPGNFSATAVLSYSVALSWSSASGAAGYNVYRNGTKLNSTPLSGTSYTDATAQPGTTYTYSVRAIGTDGSESAAATLNLTTAGSFVAFIPL